MTITRPGFEFSHLGDLIFPVGGFDFSSQKARVYGLFLLHAFSSHEPPGPYYIASMMILAR
jgi:hypothetical protein